jgi:hypothetical protein
MNYIKWILIIIGMVFGAIVPWRYQIVVLVAFLLGYAACYELKWPKFQIALASLFGGVSTGLGLHFFIGLGSKNEYVGMIVAPLLIWLALRIIFYGAETKYTLHPNAALTQIRTEEEIAPYFDESADKRDPNQTGVSAWGGDNMGSAAEPDANGQYMRYEYFDSGEIAMGGPTYGEAIFSNKCAFTGVGPSIVLSEDGRYAAMTQPSRNEWGLLIADLQEKRVYTPQNPGFWEFDRIENGLIIGRHSPITHNTRLELSIEKVIASTKAKPLLQDDGWWVMDYEGREPFKQYKAVTVTSKQGAHKVTFVPDLSPFKSNPFLRHSDPTYTVLVDDELLELEANINRAEALWVDGLSNEKINDGRFLVLPSQVIDFKDAVNDIFSVKNRTILPFLNGVDQNTYTDFGYGEKSDVGNGNLLASGTVLPRSTGWDEAEYASYSWTSPQDEDEVTYWNNFEQKRMQARTRVERYFEYTIDLDKFSYVKALKNCVAIKLVNRAQPENQATFAYQNETNDKGGYSSYQLTASCGITLENMLQEAIWSHCGRYLAVVHFEHPPLVPHKISIINFKTATINNIAGSYALPSFIWFDKNGLDFTHLIGIDEHLNFGPDRTDDEKQQLRLTDPQYSDEPYRLLIDSIAQRKIDAEKRVESKKSKIGYSGATVSPISQHCMLFAPNFDKAILQPPTDKTA